METREPLMIDDSTPETAERYGNPLVLSGEPTRSALFVPLVVGGIATGVISLQNLDRTHAFSGADQRLLTTLAGSLSVALENARLIHETRRRNAELALINGVQAAVAAELDPQAIYELVGDKIQEVYDAQTVSISIYDEATGLLGFPYVIERGQRFVVEPMPLVGFRKHVLETGEPLLVNHDVAAAAERYGNPTAIAGEAPKSVLFVPLFTGGRPAGVVSLQNVDREHAFSDSDQRLLVTLAGSVGAALQNARLVHETRQRVAELATVNSVGQALASQLDLGALIELVGERVRETFDADIAYVALHDDAAGQIEFAYYYEAGERRPEPSAAVRRGAHLADPPLARAAHAQPEAALRGACHRRARLPAPTSEFRSWSARHRSACSASRTSRRRGGSATLTRACSPRSRRTSASRSRTRACSPRSSGSASTSSRSSRSIRPRSS